MEFYRRDHWGADLLNGQLKNMKNTNHGNTYQKIAGDPGQKTPSEPYQKGIQCGEGLSIGHQHLALSV
jgi:hypothetical protein